MSDIVADLKSWRSLLRKHVLHHGKSTLPGDHNIDKVTRAIDEIERLRSGLKRATTGGDEMPNVYIEPRPKGRPEGDPIDDYVVEDHADHVLATFKTQREAVEWAKKNGHAPHVARVRHLNDKKKPDHWRVA